MTTTRTHRTHPATRPLLLLLALLGVLAALLAPPAASAAEPTWNDGRSDSDTMIDCVTGRPGTGVSAQTGWRSDDGEVPEVGEAFYVRSYIGLVSLPCSSGVAVVPELLKPVGLDYAEDAKPVRWALGPIDEPQDFRTGGIEFEHGVNGGVAVVTGDHEAFRLKRGDVLEIQVPVRATRPMNGPATQRPECQDRIDGTAPCPVTQAGDHFQTAFTVGGHGGDKQYVTPYVGLFAQQAGQGTDKVASRTTTTVRRTTGGRHGATVRVTAPGATPTGRVTLREGGRTLAAGTLGRTGRVTLRLPRLSRGEHVVAARYAGSRTVLGSVSSPRVIRVR